MIMLDNLMRYPEKRTVSTRRIWKIISL